MRALFIFPQRGAAAVRADQVEAVAGRGLVGDHQRNPHRAVTLLALESWREITDTLGEQMAPERRRANILVSGLPFADLIGKRLRLGGAELLVRGETTPCADMDGVRPGLRQLLAVGMRGGVFGPVACSGIIRVDDPVIAADSAAESQLQLELGARRVGGV